MYEKVLAAIGTACIVLITIWTVCRRDSNGRSGNGTGSDAGRIRDDIEAAGQNVDRAADDNRRAREDNQRAQQLVQKAKGILSSAQHTDSNS